jgi:hypothetical protein
MKPEYGAPSDNTTLITELEGLRSQGYDGDFVTEAGPGLRCRACEHVIPAEDLHLDALRRLEGASDPADMVAILALRCPSCGAKGAAVVSFGPTATEDEDELLRRLPDTGGEPGTRELP